MGEELLWVCRGRYEEEPQSQLFHGVSAAQNSVINLEQHTHLHTHTHIHTHKHCKPHLHTYCRKRLASSTQGMMGKCTSRWEEIEKLPADDPIRVKSVSCCYCFN